MRVPNRSERASGPGFPEEDQNVLRPRGGVPDARSLQRSTRQRHYQRPVGAHSRPRKTDRHGRCFRFTSTSCRAGSERDAMTAEPRWKTTADLKAKLHRQAKVLENARELAESWLEEFPAPRTLTEIGMARKYATEKCAKK